MANNPQSYRHFMNQQLFKHINIDINNIYVPDGVAKNPLIACDQYESLIRDQGGDDIQLLGIGRNGHAGFNELSDVWLRAPGLKY
jgi:glucosamine-6-phosphate deaminase